MMVYNQIIGLSMLDLVEEIRSKEREFFELQMRIRLGQEKDTAKKKKLRRYLAQLKTARSEKVQGEQKAEVVISREASEKK